ncbi:MAG: WGR domain-containing protein [Allorhizobium sp.]
MSKNTDNLYFERTDPQVNMARFYALWTQPTLFGEVSLIRNWGRIGTRGRQLVESFGDDTEAAAALTRLADVKQRRGYRLP